jgi:hypothetical protein
MKIRRDRGQSLVETSFILAAFMGLAASEVSVTAPGCPGVQCRVTVAIPAQGIQSTEPVENGARPTDAVPSKP